MILTNKALEDFRTGIVDLINSKYDEKIIDKEGAVEWIEGANDLIINAHIIEWFDSECIHIDTYMCVDRTYDFKVNFRGYNVFCNSRQEATEKAIIKANEIYNERTNLSN